MSRNRRAKVAEYQAAESNSSATDDEISLVKKCGTIGCNKLETEAKLGRELTCNKLVKAYAEGSADHAYNVMMSIYKKAMEGSEKLLVWLAENNLKRSIETQTGDAIIDAMTPEQRREEIKRLTKKLSLGA